MTLNGKVSASLVGVDLSCGMYMVHVKGDMDLEKLDKFIHEEIPSGFDVRTEPHYYADYVPIDQLKCASSVDLDRGYKSIGTLGGGNHFIELGKGQDGEIYLIIHSGSRNLGHQVAVYYQDLAWKAAGEVGNPDLAHLEGSLFDDYIYDVEIMQNYANWNRKAIAFDILREMKWLRGDSFTTIHNYIDTKDMILRKGAVSAKNGEKLLIPINMRDGSLLCVGKGNPDWNYSAPHGAGRLLSRSDAKSSLSLEDFQRQMEGIYTTCVKKSTLDESPMAYKTMEDILINIEPTCEVVDIIKPIYNFKA